jgi:hypothetical protein
MHWLNPQDLALPLSSANRDNTANRNFIFLVGDLIPIDPIPLLPILPYAAQPGFHIALPLRMPIATTQSHPKHRYRVDY